MIIANKNSTPKAINKCSCRVFFGVTTGVGATAAGGGVDASNMLVYSLEWAGGWAIGCGLEAGK